MLQTVLLAIGLVCVVEGLVYSVAPNMVERMLQVMSELSSEARRIVGLSTLGLGVVLVWASRLIG